MEDKKETGGPAFPEHSGHSEAVGENTYTVHDSHPGMTLRDYFAAKAMPEVVKFLLSQGKFLGENYPNNNSVVAGTSYVISDAMIKERSK